MPANPRCPHPRADHPIALLAAFPSSNRSSSRAVAGSSEDSSFSKDTKVVHAAYEYPNGETMEWFPHAYLLWELPRRQNEIDSSAVPDIKILNDMQYLNAVSVYPHPKRRRRRRWGARSRPALPPGTHDRLHAGRLGLCTATPSSARRALAGVESAVGSKEDGGCGGVNLRRACSSLCCVGNPLRSRYGYEGWLRDVAAGMECGLCACPPKSAALPRLQAISVFPRPPRYRPLPSALLLLYLMLSIYPQGQAGGVDFAHGRGKPRSGPGTAMDGEGEWERTRDAEGSVEVALVGLLASRWEK
ncbi:hypothetical protein B0H16DRAFT_1786563 [Mycena metata]|uniref:Uncharacterized protein n=1 Tax=Mycena metata TaxID=1033252 RepID=A0AAD7HMG1_9AGAR|nr:hypothetical protein B0H16DRAFT_1786563 [Mycena metata]